MACFSMAETSMSAFPTWRSIFGFVLFVFSGLAFSVSADTISYRQYFDEEGLLARVDTPSGQTVRFSSNDLGRPLSLTSADMNVVFRYDDAGNRILVSSNGKKLHTIHDFENRPVAVIDPHRSGKLTTVRYEDNGLIEDMKIYDLSTLSADPQYEKILASLASDLNDSVEQRAKDFIELTALLAAKNELVDYWVSYRYDLSGRIRYILTDAGLVSFRYDESKRTIHRYIGEDIHSIYRFDRRWLIEEIVHNYRDRPIANFHYRRDTQNNAIEETVLIDGKYNHQKTVLDSDGIFASLVDGGDSPEPDYGNGRPPSEYAPKKTSDPARDQFLRVKKNGPETYKWDGDNLTTVLGETQKINIDYNAFGLPRELRARNFRHSLDWSIDGALLGERAGRRVIHYVNHPASFPEMPLLETSGRGQVVAAYYYAGGLIGRQTVKGRMEYYLADASGRTRLILSDKGAILNRLDYSPGGEISTTNARRIPRYISAGVRYFPRLSLKLQDGNLHHRSVVRMNTVRIPRTVDTSRYGSRFTKRAWELIDANLRRRQLDPKSLAEYERYWTEGEYKNREAEYYAYIDSLMTMRMVQTDLMKTGVVAFNIAEAGLIFSNGWGYLTASILVDKAGQELSNRLQLYPESADFFRRHQPYFDAIDKIDIAWNAANLTIDIKDLAIQGRNWFKARHIIKKMEKVRQDMSWEMVGMLLYRSYLDDLRKHAVRGLKSAQKREKLFAGKLSRAKRRVAFRENVSTLNKKWRFQSEYKRQLEQASRLADNYESIIKFVPKERKLAKEALRIRVKLKTAIDQSQSRQKFLRKVAAGEVSRLINEIAQGIVDIYFDLDQDEKDTKTAKTATSALTAKKENNEDREECDDEDECIGDFSDSLLDFFNGCPPFCDPGTFTNNPPPQGGPFGGFFFSNFPGGGGPFFSSRGNNGPNGHGTGRNGGNGPSDHSNRHNSRGFSHQFTEPGDHIERSVGGIQLTKAAKYTGIPIDLKGAIYDQATGTIALIDGTNRALPPMNSDELATALIAAYRNIARLQFSLDPADPDNPRGDWLKAVYIPHDLLAGSAYGRIMYEADWRMKQYALGVKLEKDHSAVERDSTVPAYAEYLQAMFDVSSLEKENWSRYWIVPDPITITNTTEGFLFDQVKMKIEARKQVRDPESPTGLTDVPGNHPLAIHFKNMLTDEFEAFALESPEFARITEAAKIYGLALWMKQSGIQIDEKELISQMNLDNNYIEKVRALDISWRQMTSSAEKQINVFGGVDMDVQLVQQGDNGLVRELAEGVAKKLRDRKTPIFHVKTSRGVFRVSLPPISRSNKAIGVIDDSKQGRDGIYSYDADGRVKAFHGNNGAEIYIRYDDSGLIDEFEYLATDGQDYRRSAVGEKIIWRKVDKNEVVEFVYDATGRLEKILVDASEYAKYVFDDSNNEILARNTFYMDKVKLNKDGDPIRRTLSFKDDSESSVRFDYTGPDNQISRIQLNQDRDIRVKRSNEGRITAIEYQGIQLKVDQGPGQDISALLLTDGSAGRDHNAASPIQIDLNNGLQLQRHYYRDAGYLVEESRLSTE